MSDLLPPHSNQAEEMVLGCAMVTREAADVAMETLSPEDFFEPRNERIFTAIIDLSRQGKGIDMGTVFFELQKDNWGHDAMVLADMINSIPSTAHVKHYAETVRDYSILRTLMKRCAEITEECLSHELEPKDILEKAEKFIYSIAEKNVGVNLAHISQSLHEVSETLSRDTTEARTTGISSGFQSLDSLTSGFHPGNVIIVAARPGVGKTSMALDIARHVAVNQKRGVAFFSLEMTSAELSLRMVSALSKIPLFSLRTAYVKPALWGDVTKALETLNDSPIHIDSSPQAITPMTIRTASRRLATKLMRGENKLGLIVIDYLQLISTQGKKYNTREAEVADVSRSLKSLALDLKVPILALSQLNRQVEGRGDDARPRLSDLRESGSIEQDADMVLFVCRDKMYKKDITAQERGQTKLVIAKHRNGTLGEIDLDFNGDITSFSEPF